MSAQQIDAQHEITGRLLALRRGEEPGSWDELVRIVYPELRAIAHRQLHQEREGHTLSTTALVHEAYLRLVDLRRVDWQDRAHFFGIAARVMRQVLVDHARCHRAAKRTAPAEVLAEPPAPGGPGDVEARAQMLLALDDALTRLAALDERLVHVVECRFFGGFTEEETAAVLGVTSRTVRRDWVKARAWLQRELDERDE